MNNFLEKLHTAIIENISYDGSSFLKTLNTILIQGSNGNLVKLRFFSEEEHYIEKHYIEIRITNKSIGEVDFHKINLSQSLADKESQSLADKEDEFFPDINSYLQFLTDKEDELLSEIISYLNYFLC